MPTPPLPMSPARRPSPSASRQRGFALLITITLLAFLVLLLVSLAALTRVETQVAANSQQLSQARQNAIFGLQIAIGQLQKYAGADQRATAPATTFYPQKDVTRGTGELYDHATFGYRSKAATSSARSYLTKVETYLTPTERTAWDTALGAYWNQNAAATNATAPRRNPHWLGVFDSSLRVDRATNPNGSPTALPRQSYETNPATTFGEPKRNQLPVWLVSGNETFNFDPETATTYPSGYLTPDTALPDPLTPNATSVYVVGEKSAALPNTSTDGLDGRVKVKKVVLKGTPPGAATEQNIGHYAFWVGDESLKANFAVRDPYAGAAEGTEDYRNRLQVPQRLGWERMAGFTGSTLDVNSPDFLKIVTTSQIPLMDPTLADTPATRGPLPRNFHSLTSHSRSLLTDTALGGLRKDLTAYLKTGTGLTGTDPIANVSRYTPDDRRFRAWNGTNTGFPNGSALGGIPTWGQLRAWYTNASAGGGSIAPSQDFAPVITYINMHTGFSYDPATRQVRMHWVPAIVLWNPYDVPLASGSYDIDIGHSPYFFDFLVASPGVAASDVTLTDANADKKPDTPSTEGTFRGNITNPVTPADFFYVLDVVPNGWNNKSGNPADITFDSDTSDGAVGGTGTGNLSRRWNPMRDRNIPALRANDVANQPHPNGVYIAVDHTMKFRITGDFGPGQSRIFTLGAAGSADKGNWVPNDRLLLQKGFDPDAPASAWFPVMTIRANAPTEAVDKLDRLSRTLKFSGSMQEASYASPYVRFAIAGSPTPISESFSSGNVQFDHIDDAFNRTAAQPASAWKREIPHTARFADHFVTFDTGKTGSMYPAFRVWMEPVTSPGGTKSAQIVDYVPGFSRYNLSRNVDPHPLVDGLRNQFQKNNSDNLSNGVNFRGKPGAGAGPGPVWDEDQSDAGSEEAYSLITFQNKVGADYAPLSVLPIRNARRVASEILSLGQFQQANLSPYFWQPTFPIGNSDASPYVDREAIAGIHSRIVGGQTSGGGGGAIGRVPNTGVTTNRIGKPVPANTMVDISYLLNENLWDTYFLSTLGSNPTLSDPLPNSRLNFTREAASATSAELTGFHTASAYLQNVGALNVNSTSVEAWKALLTAFRDLKLGNNPDDTVPIARTLNPIGGSIAFTETPNAFTAADIGSITKNKDYSKVMNGVRYLTDAMIDTLAKRIVDENHLRGPYFSLADFVNRRLVAPSGSNTPGSPWYVARTDGIVGVVDDNENDFIVPSYDPFIGLQGINGALQRALNVSGINGGMNHLNPTDDDRVYSTRMVSGGSANGDNASATTADTDKHNLEPSLRSHLDTEHYAGAPAGEVGQSFQGAPGFVTQGDLLAMLGPALTARGDTFLIRTYGDALNPATGELQGRAWLEAVVQRTIEPVTPAGTTGADRYRPTDAFGRRFKIVSFRWLSESDL